MNTKRKVLIVDDESGFAHILKISLEETGHYEVRTETCGKKGLQAAREFHPDVVLLDVTMPDMSGTKVATQLREDPVLKSVPIIFVTATRRGDAGGPATGEFAYISKPASLQDILGCIQKSLNGT